MIVCRHLYVVVEGIEAERRPKPGLSQASPISRRMRQARWMNSSDPASGAKGTSEAFGETKRDGVITFRVFPGRYAGLDHRVHQPGSIQVGRNPGLCGYRGDVPHLLQGGQTATHKRFVDTKIRWLLLLSQ